MTVARHEPTSGLGEREMLEGWLEYHRDTLAWKCDGLSGDQLRERAVPPSTMSLLGLVRHMAEVERNWFRRVMGREDAAPLYYHPTDNPDGDFDDVDTAEVPEAFATWRAECEHARAVTGRHASLDDVGIRRGEEVSLRWIYVHMIEEYARHNGHADLLRERLDGSKGD